MAPDYPDRQRDLDSPDVERVTLAPRITEVYISPMPRPMPAGMFDEMPRCVVTLEDGQVITLRETFYPDEWTISDTELVGMTLDEARQRLRRKDVDYLRSE